MLVKFLQNILEYTKLIYKLNQNTYHIYEKQLVTLTVISRAQKFHGTMQIVDNVNVVFNENNLISRNLIAGNKMYFIF